MVVRNIVVINERRGRLTREDATTFLRSLGELGISDCHAPDEQAVLLMARTRVLTVYDAGYLTLAQRLALPLATLDAQLIRAAQAMQVRLFQYGRATPVARHGLPDRGLAAGSCA